MSSPSTGRPEPKPLLPPDAAEHKRDNVPYQEAFKSREAYTKFVECVNEAQLLRNARLTTSYRGTYPQSLCRYGAFIVSVSPKSLTKAHREGASKASLKCLDQNNYNKAACSAYFEAYKECKKAWMDQRKKDRREGKHVPT